jgi:hypothetical protein
MMVVPDGSEGLTMTTARSVAVMAIVLAVGLAAAPGSAQTVSQVCIDAAQRANPGIGTVWVVAAVGRGDQTVLSWQAAGGELGTCTMSATGEVVDVRVTGRRKQMTVADKLDLAAEAPETFDPYLLRCESVDGGRAECEVRPFAEVVLVEVLADSGCLLDSSWGHEGEAVWVDDGCRAVFEVRPMTVPVAIGPSETVDDLEARVSPGELRTLEGRARNACMRAARSRGIAVTDVYATRPEGEYVMVLMGVASWAQRADVTCRYDPGNDTAVIAR